MATQYKVLCVTFFQESDKARGQTFIITGRIIGLRFVF